MRAGWIRRGPELFPVLALFLPGNDGTFRATVPPRRRRYLLLVCNRAERFALGRLRIVRIQPEFTCRKRRAGVVQEFSCCKRQAVGMMELRLETHHIEPACKTRSASIRQTHVIATRRPGSNHGIADESCSRYSPLAHREPRIMPAGSPAGAGTRKPKHHCSFARATSGTKPLSFRPAPWGVALQAELRWLRINRFLRTYAEEQRTSNNRQGDSQRQQGPHVELRSQPR